MPDNNQTTQHGDTHPDVRLFTQGLRALPTDTIQRVNHFISEYLGTPEHPVPFGGRTIELAQLTGWLNNPHMAAYQLLVAPAGRGKSALLVHWCQQLFTEQRGAVAYFPISIRFRTNLAGVALPALVALLANLHQQPLPSDPNVADEVWRRLLLDYLSRPLPDKRSLLLVLDGIDEAADWLPGPDIIPARPPAGLHILLAARSLANDPGNSVWLQRLGWKHTELAQTLELEPLDRTGISQVLLHMGVPLSLLGTRVNIISELYRLSEGDPLLIRLYVDDLWQQGNAVLRFQPEDLRAIRPGLAGYFERWWHDQRLLWEQEAPEREAITQKLLSLLAGALGPLSQNDIMQLLPDENTLTADNLALHIQPLARFVSGDGKHQGYVFSHPRLAHYFLEEHLSDTERQDIEQRFLFWGQTILEALRLRQILPTQASFYIIQYYGAHLERANADAHTLLRLVDDTWRLAWEKLDRGNAGFLGDIDRAWKATIREDQASITAGSNAPLLGEELRCLLSQTSINSVTSNISPHLMLEAVKATIWTPAQGLACIRLITDLAPRARELVGLAPFVTEPLRSDILQEALETALAIKDEYTRLNTLIELAPALPEALLWQILDIVPTIDDEADQAGILSELATALAPYHNLLEQALDFASSLEDEEYQALALEGLAPYLDETQEKIQIIRTLELTGQIHDERFRAPVLVALLPYLDETQLQKVLAHIQDMVDPLTRIRSLAELIHYLPTSLQETTLQEILDEDIEDPDYRIEILLKLAPRLTDTWLDTTLSEIQNLRDDNSRVNALSELLPFMHTDELRTTFLKTALHLKNEEYRTRALQQCIPLLTTDELQEVLEASKDIWDEGWRSDLLAHIKLYAPETLLPALLDSINSIQDPGYRVWLLTEPGNPLVEQQAKTKFHIPDIFETIPDRNERLQTFLAIAPRLTSDDIFHTMLAEIFDFSWRVRNDEQRTHIICKLAPKLQEQWLFVVLDTAQSMNNEIYQIQILIALAPRLHGKFLTQALDIIRGMNDQEKRAHILEAFITQLPPAQKRERIQDMLQVLQIIKDERERTRLLVTAATFLPEKLENTDAMIVITTLQIMQNRNQRAQILVSVLPHLPTDWLEWILDDVYAYHQDDQAKILSALAPHMPARFFHSYLEKIIKLQEHWRKSVKTDIIPYIPAESVADMYKIVRNQGNSIERREAYLEILVALVTEETFQELWQFTQAVKDEGKRIQMLEVLSGTLPTGFFPTLWQEIQTISNTGWRLWILKAAIAGATEETLMEIWNQIESLQKQDQGLYMQALLLISSRIPSTHFPKIWKQLQQAQIQMQEITSWHLLADIIKQAPEIFIPEIFKTIRDYAGMGEQTVLLNRLLPRLSEAQIAELLPELLDEKHGGRLRIGMLTAIAPYTPAHFFASLWKILRDEHPPTVQLHVLKAFLPHLTTSDKHMLLDEIYSDPLRETHTDMLDVLIPYLSAEMLTDITNTLLPELINHPEEKTIQLKRRQARILATLIPCLTREQQETGIALLLAWFPLMNNDELQNWILQRLVVNPPTSLLPDILSMLQANTNRNQREALLHILLHDLPSDKWETLQEIIKNWLQKNGELVFIIEILQAAKSSIERSQPALLYPLIQEIQNHLATQTRRETLTVLQALLPAIKTTGGSQAILDMYYAILETGRWWEQ